MAETVAKRVSDIDDAEMKGYFNTKKEMMYKKVIWELMNKDYLQPRNEKNKKSSATAANTNDMKRKKRVEKEEVEEKKKKQRFSSKINFEVLKKQQEEEIEGGRKVETESEDEGIGEERNQNFTVETEENYSEENEEIDYGNAYYGTEEEDDKQGYNSDEDCNDEDY